MDFRIAERLALAALISASTGASFAQDNTDTPEKTAAEVEFAAEIDPLSPEAEPATEINPDEMADQLNSQQQLQQTVTLQRTINGEVVESEKRTITYERGAPYRETEAGQSALEALKTAFDGELLTRVEAFEEAKLDFTVADVDRDGQMTSEEFENLVASWRENGTRKTKAPNKELARQRQYEAFLAEIDPEAANLQFEAHAAQKFAFMAGASETVSRKDYVREYLLDFDSMDENKDMLLKGQELLRFRALNRGETIDM